jgi:hypothetical protein
MVLNNYIIHYKNTTDSTKPVTYVEFSIKVTGAFAEEWL